MASQVSDWSRPGSYIGHDAVVRVVRHHGLTEGLVARPDTAVSLTEGVAQIHQDHPQSSSHHTKLKH